MVFIDSVTFMIRLIQYFSIIVIICLSFCSCKKDKGNTGTEEADVQISFTLDASSIGEYSATLNGRVDKKVARASGTRAWFLWSGSEDTLEWLKYRGDKVEAEIGADGTFCVGISSLKQSTKYYFATAVLYDGEQYYGEVKSFTTTGANTNLRYTAQAVDLGLPSGLLWSAYNLGASAPEEYGAYFAWGELDPKDDNMYDYEHYKWCQGTDDTMTKYCISEEWGNKDDLTELEPADDVTAVKLGGGWRMPTKAEQDELRAYTTWKWVVRDGVAGCEVTSTVNEETLFFPAAGAKVGFGGPGSTFSCWSSTLSGGHSRFAWVLCGENTAFTEGGAYRCHGHTVRPVKMPE